MKLDEFISSVLTDIDKGLSSAQAKTDRDYHIPNPSTSGVTFDIAVVSSKSKKSKAKGEIKASFVKVLGAGVEGNISESIQNSNVSRIKFTVSVPGSTRTENAEYARQIEIENAAREDEWRIGR